MAHPWITPQAVLDRPAFYEFSKAVNCAADARVTLRVSADTRYILSVNGHYICQGPCISDTHTWKYETADIPREYLVDGDNLFHVRVMHMRPSDPGFFSGIRGERPALWLEGTVKDADGEREFWADETWTCLADYGTELVPSQNTHPAMPPVEVVRSPADKRSVGCRVYAQNHLETMGFNIYGLADKYVLEPRSIPNLAPEAAKPFTLVKSGSSFMELDAGAYTTACPTFAFRGEKGGKVTITYAECYVRREGEKYTKGMRDDTNGEIVGAYDTVYLTGEEQTFTPFWYKAFRFVRLDFPEGTEAKIEDQLYRPYFYPLCDEAQFECSDEEKNAMWAVSKNTLLCSSHETFVDCPYYEQCQYDMDSAIEAAVMMRLTGDRRLVKKAIVDLSRSQRPDGLLLAHYPSVVPQVIPGFSIFWILMLEDYVFYSGDTEFGLSMLPVADKILTFFRRSLNDEGLCRRTPYWNFVDWVPGWVRGVPAGDEDKPLTVSTLLYSAGCRSAARVAQWARRGALSEEYRVLSHAANAAAMAYCFDQEKGLFVDVPGSSPAYSEHTAVWAVLSECVTGEKARDVMEAALNADFPVGKASFSFNYYTFRALEKCGLYDQYAPRLFKGWQWMLKMHCTTWCENPDDPRSECHGWSSAPLYECSAMVLGVKPALLGAKEIIVRPRVEDFAWARGTVPTAMGYVAVEWKQGQALTVSGPRGQVKRVILPGGKEIVSDEEKVTAAL